MGLIDDTPPPQSLPKRLQAWNDFFEQAGVDVDQLPEPSQLRQLKGGTWTTAMKLRQDDGTDRIEHAQQARAGWVLNLEPQWPVVQPSPRPKVGKIPAGKPVDRDGWQVAVCLPDIQAPWQDEAAVDVALQLVRHVSPDAVVLHGDNADLAEMSRFRQHPFFAESTQTAVDWLALFAARLRKAAGTGTDLHWLEGNHEARLARYILDNAAAAHGLRRANTPESWPVLSIPELCHLADHDVVYHSGYPANRVLLGPMVQVVHGAKTGPAAARNYLRDAGLSTVFGHVHSRMWAEQRLEVPGHGPVTKVAVSSGALCRVDGQVPGTMQGFDQLTDRPVEQTVDWQQGVTVVTYRDDSPEHHVENVQIVDGQALYGGRLFTACVDVDGQRVDSKP